MLRVYKYELEIVQEQRITMPSGARILHMGMQHSSAMMWAEVHWDNEPEVRTFYCHGTGHDIPEDGRKWVGTVPMGSFVWHFYEKAN